MGSAVFRCQVTAVEDRTLGLAVEVADGQSIAGMDAAAMPRSAAFALQFLVETLRKSRNVDPRLAAFAAGYPDAAALRAAAPEYIVSYTMGPATGFPILEPGHRYNEQVERGTLEPGRFTATIVVTDPAYLGHLAPGWAWDSSCGELFE